MAQSDSTNAHIYKGLSLPFQSSNLLLLNSRMLIAESYETLKVQKRGSVGRSIDVTRYSGYDELRHDLARMFGIEGQLEDPLTSDWKLVYTDHENDILLVGDDPWEYVPNLKNHSVTIKIQD